MPKIRSQQWKFAVTLPWSAHEFPAPSAWINQPSLHMQRRQWHPTPVLLPGKSHGRRSLVGCSPWGREESDRTERLHFHFSVSCIGEGHGNPLQCSCLENPRDGEPGGLLSQVAQSRTRLKRLSSSGSSHFTHSSLNGSYQKYSTNSWIFFDLSSVQSLSHVQLFATWYLILTLVPDSENFQREENN